MKIAILGSTGMVGHMVLHYLARNHPDWNIIAYARDIALSKAVCDLPNVQHKKLDGHTCFQKEDMFDFTINCVAVLGKIESDASSVANAIFFNSTFVHLLAQTSSCFGRIIHISTDAVFSGVGGDYSENAPFKCSDIYSMTKALGEISSRNLMILRCSFIGIDIKEKQHPSLLTWFLKQEGTINGYMNHYWNGISNLQFAKICETIINKDLFFGDTQHIVPMDSVNKYELLNLLKVTYCKSIIINPHNAGVAINRTLMTVQPRENFSLWDGQIKTIKEMVIELSEYNGKYHV